LDAEGTLVEQVVGAITGLIDGRQLAPGQKLPSVRVLAESHGISKSTVVEAYDRLVAEGKLTSRPKSGFFVNGRRGAMKMRAEDLPPEWEADPAWTLRYALRPGPEFLRPGCGWLPEDWMDGEAVQRALRAVARSPRGHLTQVGAPLGFAPLRSQLQAVFANRGIEVPPSRILITDGATHAVDLVIRLLVQPGDTVFVDDPCYLRFISLLRVARAKIVGIPFRETGPDTDVFAVEAERHRPVLYVTNSALHNPTGATVSPAVAHRLLRIAEAQDIAIVEDDIYADFEEQPGPRLAAMDQLARVIYVGSFAKSLSGAARCGWIAARQDWIEQLTKLKLATVNANDEISAQIVCRVLTDGSYRKHTDAVRSRLRPAALQVRRRMEALGLTFAIEPQGGLFVWGRFPDGVDTAQLVERAVGKGIAMAPGNAFSISRTATACMRFNVAHTHNERIYAFLKQELAG